LNENNPAYLVNFGRAPTVGQVQGLNLRIPTKPATDSTLNPATGNALNPATQNALNPASPSVLEFVILGS